MYRDFFSVCDAATWRNKWTTTIIIIIIIIDLSLLILLYRTAGSVCAPRSDNFIVGLTNWSPKLVPPVIGNYTVCGQYPGAVAASATVSLNCTEADLPPARYVIVQFPAADYMNFCELDVCANGTCIRCSSAKNVCLFCNKLGQRPSNS